MTARLNRIETNPKILLGKPVIRGTRIPVYMVVNLIAKGKTVDYMLNHYPDLTREDITQALQYAAWTTTLAESYV